MENLPPAVFYGLILITISFLALLFGAVLTYFWIIKKHFKDSQQRQLFDEKVAEQVSKILQEARLEAENIRNGANVEAEKLIASAEQYKNERQQLVQQELDKVTDTYKKQFEAVVAQIQQQISQQLQNIPQQINQSVSSEIDSFQKNFKSQLAGINTNSQKMMEDTYKNYKADIEAYKQQRFKQIDDSILDIVKVVAREVLGKQITIDEHEKIVLKTLEEAKNQQIF